MAVEIKVAPDEKLELVRAQIIDNSLNSDYFNVTELSDTFSGGKNAFLIAGSELLEPNTEVKVQIRDSAGEVLYLEFSDGYPTEYYEGISKVVAVYVYPTVTAFGPATITLVGQVRDSLDLVKWERQINIDPSLPNTTKVRFYKRPIVSIIEQLAPIYSFDATGSKVASNVTQSFANIKVSQLDTFAGDVKRVKVYRTSKGDISDYDLIQDILVESKELLTTTALSGSVVGEAGLFTTETLKKLWNTGSLSAELTSSRIDNGLSLKGSGYLRYTSSLNLTNGNTYELGIDAFYSASTNSDMGIYVSGSKNGATLIGTLNGTTPTKNLKDQVYSFTLDKAEPTASLYFSQSQSEWHVGNISLKLSEDSAFSPSEISFVTSMPTVLGNETYNFKFEFYDVNNNYVPVAVTQSAVFTGGNNNIGGTLILISGSISASEAGLLALSQSVSGTIGVVTGSVSQSFYTSSLYSASLQSSSLYISASVSGTISNVSQSVSGTISLVSQSFSSSLSTISASTATTFSDVNSRIFTDATGLVNKAPSTGIAGLYTGQSYLGYHNGNGLVSGWKTYMANNGNFFLTSSAAGGGFLAWDSAGATLQIKGSIDIIGGQAATDISNAAKSGSNAYASASAYSGSLASSIVSVDSKIFTDSNGKLAKTPSTSTAGLYLGSNYMGYYDGSNWKTYMANNGNFYLSGTGTNSLSWNGSTLSINGAITATSLTLTPGVTISNSQVSGLGTLATQNTVSNTQVTGLGTLSTLNSLGYGSSYLTGFGALAARSTVNNTYIDSDSITTDKILANTIVAANIGSLNFYGKTAKFDTGDIGGWTIAATNLSAKSGQTVLASDGTIKLKDTYGVTKVSLNYDTTNATDPLNATAGTISVTGLGAGTATFNNGTLTGQGPNGYLQGPGAAPNYYYGPTWNIATNFTVPLTATYEFTLKFPVSSQLYAYKSSGTGNPIVQLRLYIRRNSDSQNMNVRDYISIPDEPPNGQAVGTAYYAGNTNNTFYLTGIPLVAGESYNFNVQYIVNNCNYGDYITIGYYLPSITANYFAAVASSNMNQSGINLGQDTDRYIFTKAGALDFYQGRSPAVDKTTIGEQAGSMLLLNSDLYGYFNDWQRLYINNASYPRSNRSSGGNFITSHFFGGWNRSFLNLRAYAMFEPDSTTGFETYASPWWPYSLNVDKVTYVGGNTFTVTFVEPLYGTESFPENGGGSFYSVVLANAGAPGSLGGGMSIIRVYNGTAYGFTMELNDTDSSGGRVSILVYK